MSCASKTFPPSFFALHWMIASTVLLATLVLPATGQKLTPTIANVPYCPPGVAAQELDIYNPTNQDPGPWPLLIHIHGGAWSTGDKALTSGGIESHLMASGWAVASINYRLAPAYQFPAMIEDSKCAVRFLRANAATYNFDPGHFLVKGESSGAHLAMLVAAAGPEAGWDGGDWPGVSSTVEGVWDGYGPADLSQPDLIANLTALFEEVFGTTDPSALLLDSPINYLTAQSPPIMIVHGELDATIFVDQAIELDNRLIALGVPDDLILVANAGHELVQVDTSQPITPDINQISTASGTFLTAVPPGSGPSFSMSPPSMTQVVSAGQSASYSVEVVPAGGFSGTIVLTCSGAPMNSVCSAPGSVSLDGSNSTPVAVTVTTEIMARLTRPPGFPLNGIRLAMLLGSYGLLGIVILATSAIGSGDRRRRVLRGLALLYLLGAGITLSSCGGGASSSQPSNFVMAAPGTYNLTLIGTSAPGSTPLISTAQLILTVQ
jgi:acetyl esterase/lipase